MNHFRNLRRLHASAYRRHVRLPKFSRRAVRRRRRSYGRR